MQKVFSKSSAVKEAVEENRFWNKYYMVHLFIFLLVVLNLLLQSMSICIEYIACVLCGCCCGHAVS